MAEINSRIAALRDAAGIKSEFHWSDYRGGKRQAAYEALVKYAFELIGSKQAALHIIVAKFDGYNHKAKEGDNRDTSVNRMYYQLLLHRVARYYGAKRSVHVRLDAGNDSKDICALRNELCAAAYHKYKTAPNCVKSIEGMCSRASGIIQMADVIVGAISAKRNKVEHTSPKGALADYVLACSGLRSWDADTAFHARFLTVWHHTSRG